MRDDLLLGLGIGFVAGVVVGGVTALLLTPVSGEEMRGEIRDRAVASGQYLKDSYDQASEWVVDQTGKLRKVQTTGDVPEGA